MARSSRHEWDSTSYPDQEARHIRQIIELRRAEAAANNKPLSCAVLARTRSHLTAIATELRRANVPFRGVEIEPLAERQEVLDCLALTRALLHPADRIAWLAVLRAPWCGLQSADLLTLTGEGPSADPHASIADLLATRGPLLSADAQPLLARAWPVLSAALAARASAPLSTLTERTWLSLGGDAPLTPDQRSNAARFFLLLRQLEAENSGRIDLPIVTARLHDLYAEPTGTAQDVQLMTIHKAKGLEWDLVLVPGLERRTRADSASLLNWLELENAEIVLAPIYRKGEDADPLNRWLSSIRSARDFAERKRLFYVACTRAKEELHLFAALGRTQKGGLAKPEYGSLLQACWPAAEPAFTSVATTTGAPHLAFGDVGSHDAQTTPALIQRLEDSLAHLTSDLEDESTPLALAASIDESGTSSTHSPELFFAPPKLQRLPLTFNPRERFHQNATGLARPLSPATTPFTRPEGSFAARAFGNVVHRFLELLSSHLSANPSSRPERSEAERSGEIPVFTPPAHANEDITALLGRGFSPADKIPNQIEGALAPEAIPHTLLQALPTWLPRIEAALRAEGLSPTLASRESARVLLALQNTLADPAGLWLLSPHPEASTEAAFTTPTGTLRADRVFLAGPEPRSSAATHLWIVDFKTTDQGARSGDLFAALEREKYAAQLESYATLLRSAQPTSGPIRLALYYPLNALFLNWASDTNPSFPSPETGNRGITFQ